MAVGVAAAAMERVVPPFLRTRRTTPRRTCSQSLLLQAPVLVSVGIACAALAGLLSSASFEEAEGWQ